MDDDHVSVDLETATAEQIFDELERRFEDVLLVVRTTSGSSADCQNDEYKIGLFHSDPITCLGLCRYASRDLIRTLDSGCRGVSDGMD